MIPGSLKSGEGAVPALPPWLHRGARHATRLLGRIGRW